MELSATYSQRQPSDAYTQFPRRSKGIGGLQRLPTLCTTRFGGKASTNYWSLYQTPTSSSCQRSRSTLCNWITSLTKNPFCWSVNSTKSLSDISRKGKDRAEGALAWLSQVIQASVCTYCQRRSPSLTRLLTPNSGKSCFLYYLLFRLLSMKKSVAFQVGDKFLLFQDTGVRLCDTSSSSGLVYQMEHGP